MRQTTVVVAGVGGLGSAASVYLTVAGIGKLIIIDKDVVEETNLNRQILYTSKDIGRPKVYVAAQRLRELNPEVEIVPVKAEIGKDIEDYVREANIVVDGLDTWRARFILDKLCWRNKRPYIHAGVYGMYGQLTTIMPGKTPCLRCIMRGMRDKPSITPVIGVTPGVLGIMAAAEAIKLATGYGRPAVSRMIIVDLYSMEFHTVELRLENCNEICNG